jgi:membrane protease YdiL (CAAX protease family)
MLLAKIINFKTDKISINKPTESAIVSLVILCVELIISFVYLLIIKKYFINVSGNEKTLLQVVIYFAEIFLVLAVVIFRGEGIRSIGIRKSNISKSIIIGILLGIIYFILINKIFKINKVMEVMSTESFEAFINLFIVGFSEEVIFRGYLQTRLSYWIGTKKGYLLTVIIFSFYHLPNRMIIEGMSFYGALVNCVALIPISLTFGYIMIKTKNVITGSIFHTFVDWTQTVIQILR